MSGSGGRDGVADPFAIRRRVMVEKQLLPRGVRDPRVLEAMSEIPREIFVEEALRARAYTDSALPIGQGQTISQPYIVARMTELMQLDRGHRVLEIGTGTGFQTALLARVAGEVYTVERLPALARKAEANLRSLGFENVRFRVADGSLGWAEAAPFHRIVVAAAAPAVPPTLVAQLAPGGLMVVPVGSGRGQVLTLVETSASGPPETRRSEGCVFVRLVGREGWPEEGRDS